MSVNNCSGCKGRGYVQVAMTKSGDADDTALVMFNRPCPHCQTSLKDMQMAKSDGGVGLTPGDGGEDGKPPYLSELSHMHREATKGYKYKHSHSWETPDEGRVIHQYDGPDDEMLHLKGMNWAHMHFDRHDRELYSTGYGHHSLKSQLERVHGQSRERPAGTKKSYLAEERGALSWLLEKSAASGVEHGKIADVVRAMQTHKRRQ